MWGGRCREVGVEVGVGRFVWVWGWGGTFIDFSGFCASKNRFMHSYRATDNVCACVEV